MTAVTIPILPSNDFNETSRFFGALGFGEVGRWPAAYLILEHRAGIELHFFSSPRLEAASNDHGAYVRFPTAAEVDDLYAGWVGIDLSPGRLTDPSDTDYGLREFALLDSMLNLIRVGGHLPT